MSKFLSLFAACIFSTTLLCADIQLTVTTPTSTVIETVPTGGNSVTLFTQTYDDGSTLKLKAVLVSQDSSQAIVNLKWYSTVHKKTYETRWNNIPLVFGEDVVYAFGSTNSFLTLNAVAS